MGPYSASSTRPATIVGIANGTSMITLRIDLPQNRSRTSTQAMIVPITMLITVTIAAAMTVSTTAAQVWSFCRTLK